MAKSVTFGTEVKFVTGLVRDMRATEIDTDKFVVGFVDLGDSHKCKVVVATVSGTVPTFGTVVEVVPDGFVSGTNNPVDVCKLSANKFAIIYANDADDDGYIRIGTVSGTTITLGSAVEYSSNTDITQARCCPLDTDKFAIICSNKSTQDATVIGVTVSGTTPTVGTFTQIEAGTINSSVSGQITACTQLDTDSIVAVWSDDGDSNNIHSCNITFSGTTPTINTVNDSGIVANTLEVRKIDTNKCVICYASGASFAGVAVSNSGGTLSFGTPTTFSGVGYSDTFGISIVDTTNFIVAGRDSTENLYTYTGSISGTTITAGTLNNVGYDGSYVSTSLISSNKITYVYENSSDSDGYAIIGEVSTPLVTKDLSVKANIVATELTFGTAVEFESGAVRFSNVTKIDTDKVAIAYMDDADSDKGKAVIATISGTTPSPGTAVQFCPDIIFAGKIGICKLDTDKFLVGYVDDTQFGDDGQMKVATVSGTTPTFGSEIEFSAYNPKEISLAQLETDKYACVWHDASYDLRTEAGTISGTTITSGTEEKVVISSIYNLSVCKLDTDKYLLTYIDTDDNRYIKAMVVTVSGTTVTAGTIVNSGIYGGDYHLQASQLSTNKAVIAYVSGVALISAVVISVSGTTPSFGSDTELFEGDSSIMDVGCATLTDTKFVVSFKDKIGVVQHGKVIDATISGTTITAGDVVTFSVSTIEEPAICALSSTKIAIAYEDVGDSQKGKIIIGEYTEVVSTITKDTSVKANITRTETQDFNSKANISRTETSDTSSKANIATTTTSDTSSKANIKTTSSNDLNSKANISKKITKDLSIKANISTQQVNSFNVKANIKVTKSNDFNTKANILLTNTKDVLIKSNIQSIKIKNLSVKANIGFPITKDILVKANLLNTNTISLNSKANILRTESKDFSVKASIKTTRVNDTQVKANIKATKTKDLSVKSNILRTETKDTSTKANISSSTTYDSNSKANILVTKEQEFSSKANILRTTTYDSKVKASIVIITTNDTSTKANIKSIQTYDTSVKASILNAGSFPTSSKANIIAVQTKDLSVKSNILRTVSSDTSAKASLHRLETKDLSVKANILRTETNDTKVKANIYTSLGKDCLAKANIFRTEIKDTSSKANIVRTLTKNTSSKASIVTTTISNTNVKANILVTKTNDLNVKASIETGTQMDVSVKANIARDTESLEYGMSAMARIFNGARIYTPYSRQIYTPRS